VFSKKSQWSPSYVKIIDDMMLRQHIDRKKGQWGLSGVETLLYTEAEFQKISQVAWGALPEIRKKGGTGCSRC
jgi:hypothetical protein